jgi:hypothetical protein
MFSYERSIHHFHGKFIDLIMHLNVEEMYKAFFCML